MLQGVQMIGKDEDGFNGINGLKSPFEGARLLEAHLFKITAQRPEGLYFGYGGRLNSEEVEEEMEKGRYVLFRRSPDYESKIGSGAAVFYFRSGDGEGDELLELTYAWVQKPTQPEINDECVSVSPVGFNEEYQKEQDRIRKYPPRQKTITPFATEEFYKPFMQSEED